MAITTTEYPLDSTTTEAPELLTTLVSDMLASSSSSSYIEAAHDHHNQITFEIPSHRDLEHIDTLHSFNTLLQRIAGNVVAAAAHPPAPSLGIDAAGQHITSEQISQSVVLDLAELKDGSASGLERFFAGADMHSIINYLWIGVVTSLVILSVIFIVFSCYFYRKFREWKKCNKDIRSHLSNDMYPGGTLVPCGEHTIVSSEAAYYQVESPPCYTIATGLPTYDEALHHQHFSYGMKFVYPAIAAVHHHPAISGAAVVTSTWEKEDLTLKRKERQQQQKKQKSHKVTTLEAAAAPPLYVDAASVALLSTSAIAEAPNEKSESVFGIRAGERLSEQQEAAVITTTTDDSDGFVVIIA